jgi:uncharacterized 2Fe-2S/4Fe-4S cluster protein (DUF4445 family)
VREVAREIAVTFKPLGSKVFVLPGTILLEAAARAGLIIDTPCGGTGKCGKCRIRVISGVSPADESEIGALGQAAVDQGYRLACRCRATGPMEVEIPDGSLFERCHRILETGVGDGSAVEANDSVDGFGVAFDVGTTTLVGTLVDLKTGADLGVTSSMNPQVMAGDDVVSRISKCRENKSALHELQSAVLAEVRAMIGRLATSADIDSANIRSAVFAGNTTMEHLLAGIDPSPLGEIPFEPVSCDAISVSGSELDIGIGAAGSAYVLPLIGGFIGGDTVAGIISGGLDRFEGRGLLIDIGTNGELVLVSDGKMVAASVAAGPAFEGARIVNGMRAARGAIEKVEYADGDIRLNVIGACKPQGICGTGLVDAAAEMLRHGVMDEGGRVGGDGIKNLPAGLKGRLVQAGDGYDFVLVPAAETETGSDIHIHQRDVRELQLANGAIRAGIAILLKVAGLKPEDLDVVLIAGAFGNFIRRRNARRIGMLPPIPSSRIRYIGNAASFGAKRILLSGKEKMRAERAASRTEHVDLSMDPEFQEEFGAAMVFPGAEVDNCR